MKYTWFILLSVFTCSGCMSSAQKAQQQAQINQLVSQMTPEQRGELAKQILIHETGLDVPQQSTPSLYAYPTQCYTNQYGYTACW